MIASLLQAAAPLATAVLAQSNWARMGDRFSGRGGAYHSTDWTLIAGAAVAVGLLVWGLSVAGSRRFDWASRPSPRRLFARLCRTHGLVHGERRLLVELAGYAQADSPAELFLRPELFQPGCLPPELRDRETEVRELAAILFVEPGGKG
ncbi:MAG: hypothetical protein AAF790_08315 [Planctomycetota bacterium]